MLPILASAPIEIVNTNVYVIIEQVLDVREYIDTAGRSPFTKWLRALNVHAAAKVATALERVADGNLSNVKAVGNLSNVKAGWYPFNVQGGGNRGPRLIFLLRGGMKKRQPEGIPRGKGDWED